jgi:hypothetical protein
MTKLTLSSRPASLTRCAGDFHLFGRDVERGHLCPGTRQHDGQRPPAAADLQHAHARFELQLGNDVDELVDLRLFQALMLIVIERAGIVQPLIKKQPVELGRQVVMAAGLLFGVATELACWRRRSASSKAAARVSATGTGSGARLTENSCQEGGRPNRLQRSGAVHIGFSGGKFGVEEQLARSALAS